MGNAVDLVNLVCLVDAVGSFVRFVSFVWAIWLGQSKGFQNVIDQINQKTR